MSQWESSVTFESDTQPPRTHRGEVGAGSPQAAASQAIRKARKEFKGVRYTSVVVVLQKCPDPQV